MASNGYGKFETLNGAHPWRDVSPDGFEDYPVRYRKGGRVVYFNFSLAKEIGLISIRHPNKVTPGLEEILLKTFSIQILNEYDWKNKERLPRDHLVERLYMATRYLQSQHPSRQGRTSGDGRSIWNGILKTKSKVYDISSRGTGTTILSPGQQESSEHIETGSGKVGYGSGLADLEEMLGGAIMSEIFYNEDIPTERCLLVIGYKDKTSVGVRIAPNLIRPAHIYRYLKAGSWQETKDSFDYFINRQKRNRMLDPSLNGASMYSISLSFIAEAYAQLAAIMEEEYIFNWLAWDGDNILANGGILDYGSIRQFAGKHSKYRYEDIDRYSTTLTEQKYWARNMVQTFAQVVDFITTKEKKPLANFEKDSSLSVFDEKFARERQNELLRRIGFPMKERKILMKDHQQTIKDFRNLLSYFEDIKASAGERPVADGIDHPPVFLVRSMLRELPLFLLKHFHKDEWTQMPVDDFYATMASPEAEIEDIKLSDARKLKCIEFQESYQALIEAVFKDMKEGIKILAERSAVFNYEHRVTGDGIVWVVKDILNAYKENNQVQIQEVIDRVIESQTLVPDKWRPLKDEELKGPSFKAKLFRKIQETLVMCKKI